MIPEKLIDICSRPFHDNAEGRKFNTCNMRHSVPPNNAWYRPWWSGLCLLYKFQAINTNDLTFKLINHLTVNVKCKSLDTNHLALNPFVQKNLILIPFLGN